MPKTKVVFEPLEALGRGVDIMAGAVRTTLGARGRNVALTKLTPKGDVFDRMVVHDGVTVARSIDLEDEVENMGAQLVKQASQKQVDAVGDGTTAVMVLAQAIFQACRKQIAAGHNPMKLRTIIENEVKIITKHLEMTAQPLKSHDQLIQVATISAEDKELGTLVADTLRNCGQDGVVTVEESRSAITTVEHQKGMQIDQGYVHPLFVTNPERMEATLEDTAVLITDRPVTNLLEMAELLTAISKKNKKLVIISPEFGGDALPLLVQNKLEGKLFSICIKAPFFGSYQKAFLQDLCALTGATYVTQDAGHTFEDVTLDDLGHAQSVTSTKNNTIIVANNNNNERVQERIAGIRTALDKETDDFAIEKLRERLAKLTSGVAVIKVGGYTEVEMKERRERALDAVCAAKAAIDNGIVPGGEVAYLDARGALEPNTLTSILYEACAAPFTILLENAGMNAGQWLEKLRYKANPEWGVNVETGEAVNMIEAGIVDPVSVPVNAIRNAASVAIQLMTTGAVIVPVKPANELK